MKDIPLYLFTGFLDSGKTKFIQETLEDSRFNDGEKTLLLLCEEGEEEYDLQKMPGDNVVIREISKSDLNRAKLTALIKETKADRVVVEYNGIIYYTILINS